jgi:glycerol-3-phosphate dehydrogenase (NAD(P)+)
MSTVDKQSHDDDRVAGAWPRQRRDTNVGIVGIGRWGTALAEQAARLGQTAWLWDVDAKALGKLGKSRKSAAVPELQKLHPGVGIAQSVGELADACGLIVVAVAVERLREIVSELGTVTDGSHVLVHAVRGIEPGSGLSPSSVLASEVCSRKIGALLGPVLVDELLAGRPNAVVVASRYDEVERSVRAALAGDNLLVYASTDLQGVELAATAASAMAVALGLALELDLGPAGLALLTARAGAEMERLVAAGGGQGRTAWSLAGLGFLTVQREAQRKDVQAGRLLAQGKTAAEVVSELGAVDGFRAAKGLAALAESGKVQAHLVRAVAAVLEGRLAAREAAGAVLAVGGMRE